jgi:AGZA family xanthine/uracil permease-like MFS transporter
LGSGPLRGHRESRKSFYGRKIDDFFHLTARHTSLQTECAAGLTTFLTMSYILVVNTHILASTGIPQARVYAATAVTSALACFLSGILGNHPFGFSAGMGINTYFAHGMVMSSATGLTWHTALTCVFVQGILMLLLSLKGWCSLLQQYTPEPLQAAITVGLGFFQALIALDMMGVVVRGDSTVLLQLGDLLEPSVLASIGGLLVLVVLVVCKVRSAILLSVLATSAVMWSWQLEDPPTGWISTPNFNSVFDTMALDVDAYLHQWQTTVPLTLVLLFTAVLDTAGVQLAAGRCAQLLTETHSLPGASLAFGTAGLSTAVGALLGTSTIIIHNESLAGIMEGGRTGLTALVVGVFFLCSTVFAPLMVSIPIRAVAPSLLIVGAYMMQPMQHIDWTDLTQSIPCFTCIVVMMTTYSIAAGITVLLGLYALLKLVSPLTQSRSSSELLLEDTAAAASPRSREAARHLQYRNGHSA